MAQEVDPREKASVVRRMVRSGTELPYDKREALLQLRQRVEQLWRKREEALAKRTGDSGTTPEIPDPNP
jgi:hypothetical protein